MAEKVQLESGRKKTSDSHLFAETINMIKDGETSQESLKAQLSELSSKSFLTNENKFTLMKTAIRAHQKDALIHMVQKLGFNVNQVNLLGGKSWCLLSIALLEKNWPMAKLLVEQLHANPNIKFQSYTILSYMIWEGNKEATVFLVKELGAGINFPSQNHKDFTYTSYLPLHYAIMEDFKKEDTKWQFTKMVLEMGGDIDFQTSWSRDNDVMIHLKRGHLKGTVIQMLQSMIATMVKPRIRMRKAHIQMLIEHIQKRNEKASVRNCLEEELRNTFLFEDQEKIKTFIRKNQYTKLQSLKISLSEGIKGSPLLLAVHLQNLSLVNLLLEETKDRINFKIDWNGESSTLLLYAIWQASYENDFQFVQDFLMLREANIYQKGFFPMFNRMIFGNPLEMISLIQWKDPPFSQEEKIQEIIIWLQKEYAKNIQMMSVGRVLETMNLSLASKLSSQLTLSLCQATFKERIEKVQLYNNIIQNLEHNKSFMSKSAISTKIDSTQKQIQKALMVQNMIDDIKKDPNFLDEYQMRVVRNNIDACEQSQISQNVYVDLECVICFCLPSTDGDTFHYFSCGQHHLLCQECLVKVVGCPICKQDFNANKPQRNHLAERMVIQIKGLKESQESQDGNVSLGNNFINSSKDLGESLRPMKVQMAARIKDLEQKLKNSKQLMAKINDLKLHTDYMSPDKIEKVQRESEFRIQEALKLQNEIERIRKCEDYKSEMEIMELKIQAEKIEQRNEAISLLSEATLLSNGIYVGENVYTSEAFKS